MESERKGRSAAPDTTGRGKFVNLLDFDELEKAENRKRRGDGTHSPFTSPEISTGEHRTIGGTDTIRGIDTSEGTDTIRGTDTIERTNTIRGTDTLERTDTIRGTDTIEGDFYGSIDREVRAFEQRFGSRYLQIIGVFVISVAFSILGYYPTTVIPVWGQVAFMFLGAGILVLFGEILIERRQMEFYALGLIFAGIKLIYSSFWSLYRNLDLIDTTTFAIALIGSLIFHYAASLRYRSAVLNASFVFLSWLPLVVLEDSIANDNIVIGIFYCIMIGNMVQTHYRKAVTALMIIPATSMVFLSLHATETTLYGFSFSLDPSPHLLLALAVVFLAPFLHLLAKHYRSPTLLSEYLHEYPGSTFAHLASLFIVLAVLPTSVFLLPGQFAFLLLLTFAGLIIVHFHERGEEIVLLALPIGSALIMGIGPLAALLTEPILLLALSVVFLFLIEFGTGLVLRQPFVTEIHRKLIRGHTLFMAGMVMVIWFIEPADDIILFLPGLFLVVGIADQLFISYSYIHNLHIITGEFVILLMIGGYGIMSRDPMGYAGAWIAVFALFLFISMTRREWDLTSQILFMLGLDFVISSFLMEHLALIPALLMVTSLAFLVSRFQGPYFLHHFQSSINEISLIIRKYRLLDPYNIAALISLSGAIVCLGSSPEAWVVVPYTSFLFLGLSLQLHKGKVFLPIMLLITSAFLLYLESLLLLSYITIFPVIITLLLMDRSNPRIDQYLQMILFITVGFAVGVEGLKGGWLSGVLELDRAIRLMTVYGFYLIALFSFLLASRRFSSLLFTGMVALAELVALLMFTFDYTYSIPAFMMIMICLMGYFGIYLLTHVPESYQRTWSRDRMLLLVTATTFYYLPLFLFNYRNDVHEFILWGYGLAGMLPLLTSDILRNGFQPKVILGKTNAPNFGLTGTELFSLFVPTFLCMNFSEDISLWICLATYTAFLLLILVRSATERLRTVTMYGTFFFLPFNLLLFVGQITDTLLHVLSDVPALFLVLLYIFTHQRNVIDLPIFRRFPAPLQSDYSWMLSLAILIMGTFGCSSAGLLVIPILMFVFCYSQRDIPATPASYVMFMFIMFISISSGLQNTNRALDTLIFLSILPLFLALANEAVTASKPLTFSFSTLSFMLMFAVPWFAAGSGSFVATIVTNIVWTIFGGTAFSAGFYLDRYYMRLYGIFFLFGGIIVTIYNTVVLGNEAVATSLLTVGIIFIVASYFYYLRDSREEANTMEQRR